MTQGKNMKHEASTERPASLLPPKQKEAVMGTNNSSIVSKRSVERIYYADPQFFRYFVNKPQKRSPLINRGYWLRMHAVDTVVANFLGEKTTMKKVIINLGCGYDPLAFQWLSKPQFCSSDILFIDVDFPALIERKVQTIVSTPQLLNILHSVQTVKHSTGVQLSSKQYFAAGCDLSDTHALDKVLAEIIDTSTCLILLTAEVSMTYMPVDTADNLIRWAAQLSEARFCLLEQHLPDGESHPFAQKMIQHFKNLQTPLRNLDKYPHLEKIKQRFFGAGWTSASIDSLWDIYCDATYLSNDQRQSLNEVEAFDEWEEFVLFASHYFLLIASTKRIEAPTAQDPNSVIEGTRRSVYASDLVLLSGADPKTKFYPQRRFAAIIPQFNCFSHHSGLGQQARTASLDTYFIDRLEEPRGEQSGECQFDEAHGPISVSKPSARMCHTITAFQNGYLLVGGRTSPTAPCIDCWKLTGTSWHRTDDLPLPLFRHVAASIQLNEDGNLQDAVLVYGGKHSAQETSDKWLLWRETIGWQEIPVVSKTDVAPRFGAAFTSISSHSGLLLGGMASDGVILQDQWKWIVLNGDTGPYVNCKSLSFAAEPTKSLQYVNRFGAILQCSTFGLFLIGGVSNSVIPQNYEILKISNAADLKSNETLKIEPIEVDPCSPRSLLVGHSACSMKDEIFIVGGGALCFSFGTFWNPSPLVLSSRKKKLSTVLRTIKEAETSSFKQTHPTRKLPHGQKTISPIERLSVSSGGEFEKIVRTSQPLIMENLDLGLCVSSWQSLDVVKEKVGENREIVVHQSDHTQMNFQRKNFKYIKKSFGLFLDEIGGGAKQYLRSLASEEPAKKPADLTTDFAQLAQDFSIPACLQLVKDRVHSSVLRISGPVNMWLHYDVLANVLCQIRGTKELILFPPSDVSHLSLPAGSSSSGVNCFAADFEADPELSKTHPTKAILKPGDVLFIPPLWLHTASPTDGVSISVNVFFRNLDTGYASGRDIYGNRDVQAYEKGRKEVEKICQSFDRLPADMRGFYLDRLANELKERAWNVISP